MQMYPMPTLGPQIRPQAPCPCGGSIIAQRKEGSNACLNAHTEDMRRCGRKEAHRGDVGVGEWGREGLNVVLRSQGPGGPALCLSVESPGFHPCGCSELDASSYQPGYGVQLSAPLKGFLSSGQDPLATWTLGTTPSLTPFRDALSILCLVGAQPHRPAVIAKSLGFTGSLSEWCRAQSPHLPITG